MSAPAWPQKALNKVREITTPGCITIDIDQGEELRLLPPLLRLPVELRLKIALFAIDSGPCIESAAQACCLGDWIEEHVEERADAIFEVPGFRLLKQEFPKAFRRESVIFVWPRTRPRRKYDAVREVLFTKSYTTDAQLAFRSLNCGLKVKKWICYNRHITGGE